MEGRAFRADSSVAARRVSIGIPFLAVAAIAILVIGHLVKRRNPGGKRLGGESNDSNSSGRREPDDGDDGAAETQALENPGSVEELRARRLRSMEKRLARGRKNKSNDPGSARLTPLGTMIRISRKVDELAKDVEVFLTAANSQAQQQDCDELLVNLKALRSEIDAVESDETVREHRKAQASRVEAMILELQHSKQ